MVKMESSNRKGQIKIFKDADVESAKANGWTEVGKPKAKKSKKIKIKSNDPYMSTNSINNFMKAQQNDS